MGYKCAPQIMGLVRNEPKPNAKRRANGSRILEELGNERYSKSETLDRTRSKLNEYNGFRRGKDAWESMCNTANTALRVRTKTVRNSAVHYARTQSSGML